MAVQVRILGPQDIVTELTEILAKHGFSPTGTQVENGHHDRLRSYFIAPVKQFRAEHGLALLDLEAEGGNIAAFEAKIHTAEIALPKLREQEKGLREKLAQFERQVSAEDPMVRIEARKHIQDLGNEIHRVIDQISHDQGLADKRPAIDERKRRLAQVQHTISQVVCENCGSPVRLAAAPEWLHQPLEQIKPNEKWYLDFTCTRPPIECGHRTRILFPQAGHHKSRRKKSLTDNYLPA